MIRIVLVTLLALLPSSVGLTPASARTSEIVVAPTPEQVIRYDWIQDVVNVNHIGNMKLEIKMQFAFELAVQAREVPGEGPLRFDVRYERVKGWIHSAMGKVEFDSADEQKEIPLAFKPAIEPQLVYAGKTLTVHVDRHGVVIGVEGVAAMYAGTEAGELLANQGQAPTDESVLADMQTIFARLPSGEPRVGQQWTYESDEDILDNRILFKTLGSVKEVGPEQLRLEYGTAAESIHKGTDKQARPMPSSFVADETKVKEARASGSATILRADGLALEQKLQRDLEVLVPNPLGGADIDASIQVVYTTRRRKP